MSDNGSETYRKIQENLLKSGKLFEDKDFPPNHRSLQKRGINPNIVWKRPHDIAKKPVFIREATYYDLYQGQLGNCWFIAGVNVLIIQSWPMFENVVPQNQSFNKGNYTGLFRFNFWQYGEWIEVLIDDFLPVSRTSGQLCYCWNRKEPDEFWSSLLEKAYAKLYGSYDHLDSGSIHNALVDMTGGVSERVHLRNGVNTPEHLFELLSKMWTMSTMIGLVIFDRDNSRMQTETPEGLIEDHAYAVTKLATVTYRNKQENLVRIRNPWGRKEWNGRWSDESTEWSELSESDKEKIGLVIENEGEFWMSIEDVMKYFDLLDLCHIEKGAMLAILEEGRSQRIDWNCYIYKDNWVQGISDGGSDRNSKSYWNNPQFVINLEKETGPTDTIVSLMEIMDQNKTRMDIFTGFDLFKIESGTPCPLADDNYKKANLIFEKRATETEWRENTQCISLNPGKYVVVPYTQLAGKTSRFILRIFAEKEIDSGLADHQPTELNNPELTGDTYKYQADLDWIDAFELHKEIEVMRAKDQNYPAITLESSRCLLGLLDEKRIGMVESEAVEKVHQFLIMWNTTFKSYQDEGAESMDVKQLRKLYKKLGFVANRKVMEVICKRYANLDGKIKFDDFVQSTARMMSLFRLYKEDVRNNRKSVTISKWLELTLYL